jgi:hypothetical protein
MNTQDECRPIEESLRTVKINPELAKRQNLTVDEITSFEVVSSHLELFLLRPTMYANPEEAVAVVEGFEYVLQSLLKFPMSKDYHKYWKEVAGCTCPKLDNMDSFGTGMRYINSECCWHGKESL